MLRLSYAPAKVYRLAKQAFAGTYDDATIFKWLETFYRRFFAQQFKRSCLPDGPKSEVLRYLRVGICVCRPMRVLNMVSGTGGVKGCSIAGIKKEMNCPF